MERYSTFWRRFWAGFLDGLVLFPIDWLVGRIELRELPSALLPFWLFLVYFYFSAYIVLMHAYRGQTVGKMITGVTVLTADEESPIGLKHAVLRESPYLLFLLIGWVMTTYTLLSGGGFTQIFEFDYYIGTAALIWFGLEVFSMLLNEKRRALHDFLAGTVVVRDA